MIIPRPQRLTAGSGEFVLDASTTISAPAELIGVVRRLQAELRPPTGLPLDASVSARPAPADPAAGSITLAVDPALGAESYALTVTPDRIEITGGDAAGVFYGTQAVRQLLPASVFRRSLVAGERWVVPAVEVADRPTSAWRGFMLDTVRHFAPKHEVLRIIDLLALHKLNVLHFHLTEDQGWRIEIRKYPRLTEVGGWRTESQIGAARDAPGDGRPHGGFYTQDDIREIVAYAAERFVQVVPEIETPGHVRAALAAYPELGVTGEQLGVWTRWGVCDDVLNTEQSTVDFFRDVFDEVMELFPSPFIGVGGDECPKVQWKADARTQELMRERGLADEEELQSWFIRQLDEHITAAGRRIFGWDEILEGGLAAGATVASWRGMTGAIAAARRGHDVISCPDDQVYLDYRQSDLESEPIPVSIVLTLEDVYRFDPVPAALTEAEAAHVLGGQANLWTEHIDSPRVIDYMMFPRLCALAEALWTGGEASERDFADFEARLDPHLRRLEAVGVEFRRADGPLPWQTRPGIPGRPSSREDRAAHIAQMTANIAD